MADKSLYDYRVDPQQVDFTLRLTVPALVDAILNVAGIDARRKGFGIDALQSDNYSWVLSRMALELDSRPGQYTDYRIATWINEYGRVLSTRNFTAEDRDGRVFARAVTQWCMIDLSRRTPVDLTAIVASHSQALADIPSPAEKPRKIHGVVAQQTDCHRVVYSDIDFNRHVNTLRYMDMMFDMLPIETFETDGAMRMDIHFLHECRYGQNLAIGYEQRDRLSLFEISDDAGVAAVRASLEWR